MRHRRNLLLLAASLLLLSFPAAAQAACIKRHHVRIASGKSPAGWAWKVEGSIGDNGSCREWLFGMDFDLEGSGSWETATGIPAGGHLNRRQQIDAFDDLLEDGSSRVFSGVTSGEVTKVVATLSNNKHLTFRPKAPAAELRRKVVWLRNVRYFVEYYPPEGFVTGIAEFNAAGVLVARDKTWENF